METYRHFTTVTSQLYFCSSPIRLDSYNRCQFGCVYCFSRKRGLANSTDGLKSGSAQAFCRRLDRIQSGHVQSGLDEFLQNRIPIQFGGMQDPFSPMEQKHMVTLDLMKILRDHKYPTLISTKGDLFRLNKYENVLSSMNVLVRLSAAGVSEQFRSSVDVGCSSFAKTLEKIRRLSALGLPVSLRIQPVIPGFEDDALRMAEEATDAGVSHISFEYLKIGSENFDVDAKRTSKAVNRDVWEHMRQMGTKKIGRDYTLKTEAKAPFVFRAKAQCKQLGVAFGAGDTEFIHLSDGSGCCNGSSLFLDQANQFQCNYVGVISNKNEGDQIQFGELQDMWHPSGNIHHYLTTNSRSRDTRESYPSWIALLAYRWNGGRSPYSPMLFWGVDWTGDFDSNGFKIYKYLGKFHAGMSDQEDTDQP